MSGIGADVHASACIFAYAKEKRKLQEVEINRLIAALIAKREVLESERSCFHPAYVRKISGKSMAELHEDPSISSDAVNLIMSVMMQINKVNTGVDVSVPGELGFIYPAGFVHFMHEVAKGGRFDMTLAQLEAKRYLRAGKSIDIIVDPMGAHQRVIEKLAQVTKEINALVIRKALKESYKTDLEA